MSGPILNGPRVRLRPPQLADKTDRLSVPLNAEIVRSLGGSSIDLVPLKPADIDGWYCAIASEPHGWAIEYRGRCIGTARLHGIVEQHRRAGFAVGIFDPALLGQGLGTDATKLVLAYAFDTLKLHRVDLRVLAFNTRAQHTYERCGFKREGVERDAAWIDGEWIDDIMMSLLESDWRASQTTNPREG